VGGEAQEEGFKEILGIESGMIPLLISPGKEIKVRKIRNPKSKIRNKSKIQIPQCSKQLKGATTQDWFVSVIWI
jgi:hypothetical protein